MSVLNRILSYTVVKVENKELCKICGRGKSIFPPLRSPLCSKNNWSDKPGRDRRSRYKTKTRYNQLCYSVERNCRESTSWICRINNQELVFLLNDNHRRRFNYFRYNVSSSSKIDHGCRQKVSPHCERSRKWYAESTVYLIVPWMNGLIV